MNRREFLYIANGLSLLALAPEKRAFAQDAPGEKLAAISPHPKEANDARDHSHGVALQPTTFEDWLTAHAEDLSRRPFVAAAKTSDVLRDITYDDYRDIHFKREAALWRNTTAPFQVEFFHTGYRFNAPVHMFVLQSDKPLEYGYDPSLFYFGPLMRSRPRTYTGAGFSGFRLLTRLNDPVYYNEYVVFQGASYFRATGKGQFYGLSARGLTINCGQPGAEEFPSFRSFWLQQPAQGDEAAIIYALLDGESVTGAYKFRLTPGQTTVMEVSCTLFCRKAIAHVGVAPLTSMFFFGQNQRRRFDDYRPEVHDSDGLALWNGAGEWLWRPLINPKRLQFSAFADKNPKGFGLLQRSRAFSQYQDLEARYDQRPSAWVEPLGDWGEGSVDLLELPTTSEFNDNVVAFWRPKKGLTPGQGHHYRYRIHWGQTPPAKNDLTWVSSVRVGRGRTSGARLIVADFSGSHSYAHRRLSLDLHVSAGKTANIVVMKNPLTGGYRLSFDFDPCGSELADIRGALMCDGVRVSEVWTYRWTA